MNKLKDEDLIKVEGGSKLGIITIIGGAVAFLIGFANGLLRPKTCSNK